MRRNQVVTAAIIQKDGKLLLAQRPINDKLAGKWEFPGGKVEDNESEEECLKREVLEELNIEILVGKPFYRNIYQYDDGYIELASYWVEWSSGEIKLNAHQRVVFVQISELENYEFCPADLPIVKELRIRRQRLGKG